MFGLGVSEIFLLLLISFLLLGPKKFPLVAKNLIRFLNELKNSWFEIKKDLYQVKQKTEEEITGLVKNELKKDDFLNQSHSLKTKEKTFQKKESKKS